MLAYIDAGTAAAIAAMATGGLAGAKVAVQSVLFRHRRSKTDTSISEVESNVVDPDDEESTDIAQAA